MYNRLSRTSSIAAASAVLTVFAAGASSARAQGPSSFWRFNEASGSVVMDSVGTNNGSFSGGVTRISGATGQGGALSFDNTNGIVNVGNSLGASTGLTIEALIRPQWNASLSDYDEIIRKDSGGIVLLSFQNDGNNGLANPAPVGAQGPVLSFGLTLANTYSELDMPLDGLAGRPTLAGLKDGNWHYVAAIYDSVTGVKRIAVDGVTAFSTTFAAGTNATSTPGATTIGNYPGGGEPFTGGIDEVAVYGRALSASEVTSHYNNVASGQNYFAGSAAPEPGAIALVILAGLPTVGVIARRRRKAA